ncbi:transient receptor potential cation channel subfamily A member 1-like [Durio zibethinus]|uniref:Transient receptor potential cation channel subfamily A member 1-like n=1 Tax=Durio zibethinus TaxID=66656 RepID=A0A6P6A4Y1_DURZI|nr:transient receptor potential cation channel subfamily A member 1-like [Durio zibethinus]
MTFYSVEEDKNNAYYDWFRATWLGDLDRLKELAENNANEGDLAKTIASCKDKSGRSIFHFAANAGRKRICKYLIEELKLNVDDFINDEGLTPLHSAIQGEQHTLAVYLLDKGANPNVVDNHDYTPLHMAAKTGSLKLLEHLIKKGAEIDAISDAGTPLTIAADVNRKDIMKVLLDNHANPNVDSNDLSPLYISVKKGSMECVKLLLKVYIFNGAHPNFMTRGDTPLGIAAFTGQTEMIKCLLCAEANPNIRNLMLMMFYTASLYIYDGLGVKFYLCNYDNECLRYRLTTLTCKVIAHFVKCYWCKCLNLIKTWKFLVMVGEVPIEVAALRNKREAVMYLFPVTSRISTIEDWSVEGLLNFVVTKDATKRLFGLLWLVIVFSKKKETLEKNFSSSKSKGEEAFKRKNYREAINCYTEVIRPYRFISRLQPSILASFMPCFQMFTKPDWLNANYLHLLTALSYFPLDGATIYSNLSLCWARLNRADYALIEAESCLSLRPDWPKAYYRVGRAWMLSKVS